MPTVLAAKGYSIVTSLTFTSLTFIGYPVGSALSLPVVERIDRRWLIVASAFLMSVFGLGLGYAASPAVIMTMGFLYTVASNRVFERAPHLPGRDLSDLRESDGIRHGLRTEPVVERRDAVRAAAGPRSMGAGAMFAVVAAALWIVILDIALFAPSTTGRSLEQVNG